MTRPLREFERLCGYGCGQVYRPWANSVLRGHACCAVPQETQERVAALVERWAGRASQPRIARLLNVSIGTLRAWCKAALLRRGVLR
jgi:hypothetical protein